MAANAATALPLATVLLLLANLTVAAFTLGDPNAAAWGFTPGEKIIAGYKARSVFTSLFLHIEPFHLLGNMVLLAAVGPVMEAVTGFWKFMAVYIVGGVVGVLLHWAVTSALQADMQNVPMYGASGCVSAMIGYSWLRFHRAKVPLFPKVRVPVFLVVAIWIVLQAAGAVFSVRQYGVPVAYWAHIGGFLAGFVLGLLFKAGSQAISEAWSERFQEAHERGAGAEAAVAAEYLQKRPHDPSVLKSLAVAQAAQDDTDAAVQTLSLILQTNPAFDNGYAAEKLHELRSVSKIPQTARLRAAQRMMSDAPQAAEILLDSILQEPDDRHTADALVLLIQLTTPTDTVAAQNYARQLRERFPVSSQTDAARARWPALFA